MLVKPYPDAGFIGPGFTDADPQDKTFKRSICTCLICMGKLPQGLWKSWISAQQKWEKWKHQGLINKTKLNKTTKKTQQPSHQRNPKERLTWWGSSCECYVGCKECPNPNNFAPSKLIQDCHSFSRYSGKGCISKDSPELFENLYDFITLPVSPLFLQQSS